MHRVIPLLGILTALTFAQFSPIMDSRACSRSAPVDLRVTCSRADYIVRATAIDYDKKPSDPNLITSGVPDSKVTLKVEELLKGDGLGGKIVLNGYLGEQDDFNDHAVPYTFVRPGGRHGSCFANTYKQGAQYLLLLKNSDSVKWVHATTRFTVNIDPLAPVNEQLHSPDDPWVYYIKGVLFGMRHTTGGKESK